MTTNAHSYFLRVYLIYIFFLFAHIDLISPLALGEIVKKSLIEHDASKKVNQIIASSATQGRVTDLLSKMQFVVEDVDAIDLTPTSLPRFNWIGHEDTEQNMAAAKLFIENGLTHQGVQLSRGGFRVHDVHTKKNILATETQVAKINAGTDFIVVPFSTSVISLPTQACVLFELKTDVRGIYGDEPQSIVEFLAARLLSNQPNVSLILTDLVNEAIAYTSSFSRDTNVFVLHRCVLSSIDLVFPFASQILTRDCKPSARYRALDESSDPHEQCVIEVRKKLKTDFSTSLAWEHFMDFKDTAPEWSAERGQMVWDVLRSCGVEEKPAFVEYSMMYS